MAQIWDSSITLDPILHDGIMTQCCGWAPSKMRRCRNRVRKELRLEALVKIRNLGFVHPRASEVVQLLEELLPSTLCYLHQVQLPEKLKNCLAAIGKAALDLETQEWVDKISNASTESLPFENLEDESDCDRDSHPAFSTEDVETNAIMAYPSPPPTPPHGRVRDPIPQTGVTTSFRNGSSLSPIKLRNDSTRVNNTHPTSRRNMEPDTIQQQSALQRRETTSLSIIPAQTIYSNCGDGTIAIHSPGRPDSAPSSPLEEIPDYPPSNIEVLPTSQQTLNTTLTSETQDDIITYDLSPTTEDAAITDKKIESSPMETLSLSTLAPGLNELSSDTFIPLLLTYGYTIIVVAVVGFERLWALPRSMFDV